MCAAEVDYPKKLFYKINEVSRITGIKPYVLRYWESEFTQLKPRKDGNDQRRYKSEDINLISQIKSLLYEERFTIAGARKKLKTGRSRKSGNRTKKIRKIADELSSIRKELEALLA